MDLTHMKTAKPGLDVTRIGADFPQAVAELREPVRLSVLACCGIPAAILYESNIHELAREFPKLCFRSGHALI